MTFTVIHVTPKMVDFGRIPESSYFVNFGTSLFRYATLIVGQMPVEDIHFQVCHFIQQLLHHFLPLK